MDTGVLVAVVVVMVILGSMFVAQYNGLVSLRAQLERAWSNIDVLLKQRYEELPGLMQVIEQYAGYESSLFKQLAAARDRYGQAGSVDQKMRASKELSIAVRGVVGLAEAYPELKANQNFLQLQNRVSELENALADRRESYNEAVANFNARIDQFPAILSARILNYQRQEMFEAAPVERGMPNLKMNLPMTKSV